MKVRKMIGFAAVGVLALAGIAGAFTYQTVSAQAVTPTPEAPGDGAPLDEVPGRRGFRMQMEAKGGMMQEDLAAALGIDVETLQAAHQTAAEQALAQAVEQGLITQAQADRWLERGMGGGRFAMRHMDIEGIDYDALLADALNITVEELNAAREEAFTTALNRAVEEGTLTQEQADLMLGQRALFGNEGFQTSMQSAFTQAVQQAVTDGVITQAQADAILQRMEDRGGMFGPGGRGGQGFFSRGCGGGHGGRGGGFFAPPAEDTEIMPNTDA